ncbi:MAG: metallophosphoesterase [Caulobacteraceae bacterium]
MPPDTTRRGALACLGLATGTLFTLGAGGLSAVPLAQAAVAQPQGRPLFVQISDTHIGFNKAANPDVSATLERTIDLVNAMPVQPALVLHTGDITHLSKAEEFDHARQLLSRMRVTELHTTPGEHDVIDGPGAEYFARFGQASGGRGYYSFDHQGVHFIGLVNVMHFKAGGLGGFGDDQLAWLKDDLAGRAASQPLVIFAHMPMWTIYEPWGWGTGDADQVLELTRRFGSVTVLNGHIHQIVQKTEGHVTFHTARSTAYPQPAAGEGAGPGPLTVPADELPRRLGLTSISFAALPGAPTLSDATLA